jgi:hypothetical protein
MSEFALPPQVTVLQCRSLTHLFTKIRDQNSSPAVFAHNARRLMHIISEVGVLYCSNNRHVWLLMFLPFLSLWFGASHFIEPHLDVLSNFIHTHRYLITEFVSFSSPCRRPYRCWTLSPWMWQLLLGRYSMESLWTTLI